MIDHIVNLRLPFRLFEIKDHPPDDGNNREWKQEPGKYSIRESRMKGQKLSQEGNGRTVKSSRKGGNISQGGERSSISTCSTGGFTVICFIDY